MWYSSKGRKKGPVENSKEFVGFKITTDSSEYNEDKCNYN